MVYPNSRTVDPPKTKFSPELTRASRARLGRYGFTDIMREGSGAVVLPNGQKDVVVSMPFCTSPGLQARERDSRVTSIPCLSIQSINTELMDELSRHEITIQFAAFRVARAEDKARMPNGIYFTFQFYKYVPTKTEKSFCREDTLGDKLTSILVRESQYGRDAPAKAYRFVIDTGNMQESKYGSKEVGIA